MVTGAVLVPGLHRRDEGMHPRRHQPWRPSASTIGPVPWLPPARGGASWRRSAPPPSALLGERAAAAECPGLGVLFGCDNDGDCADCGDAVCQATKCVRPPGGRCKKNAQCASGRCSRKKHKCRSCPKGGTACGGHCVFDCHNMSPGNCSCCEVSDPCVGGDFCCGGECTGPPAVPATAPRPGRPALSMADAAPPSAATTSARAAMRALVAPPTCSAAAATAEPMGGAAPPAATASRPATGSAAPAASTARRTAAAPATGRSVRESAARPAPRARGRALHQRPARLTHPGGA